MDSISAQCSESTSITVQAKSSFVSLNAASKSFVTPDKNSTTKVKRMNPFNKNLRARLESSIFSPSVFSTVLSTSQESGDFKWSIDEISKLNPANIDEEEVLLNDHNDVLADEPELQKTIDRFFSTTHIPSPWDGKICPIEKRQHGFCDSEDFERVSDQMNVSLPQELPYEMKQTLRPYFSQEKLDDVEAGNISSSRRKLFFHSENENLSPVKMVKVPSPTISCAIPHMASMMSRRFSDSPIVRTDGTPRQFSPIDVSPIGKFCTRKSMSDAMECSFAERSCLMTESPKCSLKFPMRGRKRRFTEDMETSCLQMEKSCDKMNVDSNNKTIQDTGYFTDQTSFPTSMKQFCSSSSANNKGLEDKENVFVASTPFRMFSMPCKSD